MKDLFKFDFFSYPAFKKNPPKSMKGIMRGGARASATWRSLAKHEMKYPKLTTTWTTNSRIRLQTQNLWSIKQISITMKTGSF